jgi:hypothetical protein
MFFINCGGTEDLVTMLELDQGEVTAPYFTWPASGLSQSPSPC